MVLAESDPRLAFIRQAPKTETHVHIEGAMPWECLVSLDPARYVLTPDPWHPEYRFPTFEDFNDFILSHALQWFTSPERYHEAARVIFQRLRSENVAYLETSFHGGILEFLNVPGEVIVEAIRSAVPDGLTVRLFMGLTRDAGTPGFLPAIDRCWNWDGLDGIDLHGIETLPLEDWSRDFWFRAGAAGLELKAHAGEFGGPEAIWQVVRDLGVRRVQHGVSSFRDPELVSFLRDEGVTLDMCPVSNLKLKVVPSLRDHPIIDLTRAGVRCTVSTDDPFVFGNTIIDDYNQLAAAHDLSVAEIARLMRAGFEVATLAREEKTSWLATLDQLAATP